MVVRDARGRSVGHHLTFELALDDGRILRTRISRPADATQYSPGLWRHILADQLEVTEAEFWECVRDKVRPNREGDAIARPGDGLPAWLVGRLIGELHLTQEQIAGLDEERAREMLQEHWGRRGRER